MKTRIMIASLVMAGAFLFAFTNVQKKPWPVPEKFDKMTNPVKADADVLKDAKALWVKHCQSCHGKTGLGDGTKAATLETETGDLTSADTQAQSDGALFYKTSEGRGDMPAFKKKIADEEEIWQLVAFMRTLKK